MDTAEIRRRFLSHFADGARVGAHTVVPSASLLANDPNLLFVPAGMVPFKPYFLGQETPPYTRATSVQKCIRTPDIDDVGKTTRHGTFFEMAGNFSFGDYFKEGAIELAWDLVTKPVTDGGFGLAESRLYPSIHYQDDEALALWKQVSGLPDERIVRLGNADNYWSMGIPGPGGPCSEILYDRGPDWGPAADFTCLGLKMPETLEDRYLEIWNLVFTQDELSAVRNKDDFDIAGPLPTRNIDTGLGVERVAFLMQDAPNMYEIDVIWPVIARTEELTGRRYGADQGDDVLFRVIADHVRSSLMLIGDGVTPANESRGYVLRRLMRRAIRSIRLLGFEDPALPELMPVSREAMGELYAELLRDWNRISVVAYAEEESFRSTLRAGTQIFDAAALEVKQSGGARISGDRAFALHDTYGFPIDLTLEMAAEQGLSVDEDGFRRLMGEQRERAQADARAKRGVHANTDAYRQIAESLGGAVEFTGYSEIASEGSVRGIVAAGSPVSSAVSGDEIELVLDRTAFYAESGGQLADTGRIELDNGATIDVHDVQSPITGLVVHRATVVEGDVQVGAAARGYVDVVRRRAISRAHTGTHLIHQALREALGDTASQAGSENAPGRFRFDFSATGAVPADVLADIEAQVNEVVLDDLPVAEQYMGKDEALRSGAIAMFGQKYGDIVRVVSIGEWSRELCGGTHTHSSGQLGVIKLLGESSIGSGVRRVEALVGGDAYRFLAREHTIVNQLAEALKARPEELPERVASILDKLRVAEKDLEKVRVQELLAGAGALAEQAQRVGAVNVVAQRIDGVGGGDARTLAIDVRARLPRHEPGAVLILGETDGRVSVAAAVNEAGQSQGISASDLVRAIGPLIGGKGGGKADVAQGGGSDASSLDEALLLVTLEVARLAGV